MGALSSRGGCRDAAQQCGEGSLWDGESPAWLIPLERGLTRAHPGLVSYEVSRGWVDVHQHGPRMLVYRHAGLDVRGRVDRIPVRVVFHERPPYPCYGLPWHDYPRVFADPGQPSKHRMPDDSLCLYYPGDPPERRWTADNGLVQLFKIVADHLFYEQWWRHTGGHNGGEWLGDEAEHGFPGERRPLPVRRGRRRRRAT